jgi:hypothetical protein
MIHRACLLSSTVEVTLQFENSAERAYSYSKCGMFEIKTLFNNVSESRHYITGGQKFIYR